MTAPSLPAEAVPVPIPLARRVLDVATAAALLAVLSPVFVLVAIAVRLGSSGPALFRQTRVGRGGRRYVMYKFRTLVADADANVHRDYVKQLLAGPRRGHAWATLDPDPRCTRVGRIIRAMDIDELPQLINVLRGEMSLVGPRPALPYELEMWEPWHYGRLAVLPGITGLWQVEARGRADFDEMVRMDLDYVRRQSLWMDLSILLRTPWSMLRHALAS